MKVCPFCSKEISDQATICPECGRDLAAAAREAAAQLRAVGYPAIKTVLWLLWYVVLTTLVRASILYFSARTLHLRNWSAILLAGVASLAIVGYGVFRAQQQKRSAVKLWLLVYGGWVVLWTGTTTVALLGD